MITSALGMEGVIGEDFHKYEGLGNDFVILETQREDAVPGSSSWPAPFKDATVQLARQLCDRRRGIGADGVLLLMPPTDHRAEGRMVVINADGSIPEMCGNGLRCVVLHVARTQKKVRGTMCFETDAGLKTCVVDDTSGQGSIAVDMGPVRWLEDIRLDVDGDAWDLSLADAGNPHAITSRDVPRPQIDVVGPRIATHARFPNGTNVEFAQVCSPTEIDLVVWERGVGITHACGTGACATVAVAVEKGWVKEKTDISVRLPGGVLQINVRERNKQVIM